MNEHGRTDTKISAASHADEMREKAIEVMATHHFSRRAALLLLETDDSLFYWRRRAMNSRAMRDSIRALGLDLEHAQFEGLTAIARLTLGAGSYHQGGITIGDVATDLAIDPSRASRIVADLVNRGYARRAASQSDGRRSCVELSAAGHDALEALYALKWERLAATFKGWSEADITEFHRLFSKYADVDNPTMEGEPADPQIAAENGERVRRALDAELAGRRKSGTVA